MKGVHAILTKFRSEETVRIDPDINLTTHQCINAESDFPIAFHIIFSSGTVLSTVIAMHIMFFSYGEDDDWFADREWLNRPTLFEQIWHWYLLWALVAALVLLLLVGCCCICMHHKDNDEQQVVSELGNRQN